MFRTLTPLIVGAFVGVAATATALHLRSAPDEPVAASSDGTRVDAFPGLQSSTPASSASQVSSDSELEAALAQLSLIERPVDVRTSALALIEVFGRDLESIARIASALPEADRLNFTFDAIASLATKDPTGAIQLAVALDDSPARSETIKRLATVLGGVDPRVVLSYRDSIGNYELADVFKNTVLEVWAGNDPGDFLAFVETAAPADLRGASEAFAVAAAIRPQELLALLDRIPQSARLTAERAALEVLAKTDIGLALAHLESLRLGNARNSLYRSTAQSYAEQDLEGALAWAESLRPPSNSAMTGAMWVLAKSDPVRGAELLIQKLQAGGGMNSAMDANIVLQAFTPGPPELLALVALRLSSVDDTVVATLYGSFMNDWSADDPDAAYNWALANPDRLTQLSLGYLAQNLSAARPELAKLAADRLPADMQSMWIRVVADRLGGRNLDGTLQWISRYQGQEIYQEAIGAALQSASLRGSVENPESLAAFLDQQSADVRGDSVAVVANVWAERDPAAAARWVEQTELTVATEGRRSAAFENIAARWSTQDATAAEDWALGLREGDVRDRVIGAVLATTSGTGRVDSRLIEALSSDDTRQRRLASRIMQNLGRSDPDLGRKLMDEYITDPAIRASAEERLVEGMSGLGLPLGRVVSLR